MFTSADFSSAVSSAVAQLRVVQEALAALGQPAINSLSINLKNLNQDSIGELLEDVPSGYRSAEQETDYVYVIRLKNDDPQLLGRMWEQLEAARRLATDYCRVYRGHKGSTALYVGRSKKLRTRLIQHLGVEQRGVYSMHMQRWATVNDAEIALSYMKFEKYEDLVVQAVEDGIWASLKPAFGRKGER